ncbi:rhodanese-like domain-containing protein [Fischerella thermalis]|uniref:Rhodanese-like protein n=1 Tax=Fischerella thermalis JSC-11 TaxID=741277 RepID=G6FPV3_9CYAN|nr:rhodanese-like domain-containing protein [Fischerella thermalis]EHC17838.1 Rhodanese-like protein [Fischerella thermalis JSC-11]
MILFSLLIEKLNSWHSWHLGGSLFIPILCNASVEELAQRLSQGEPNLQLVDVREPQEVAIAHIEGFVNLPLSGFAEWGNEIHTRLDPDAETLVLCHYGIRSAQMCQWLVNQGFTNVKNISGGIDAYSMLVDPSIPVY